MTLLHEKFESGAMFTAGASGANTGVSGINEITTQININSLSQRAFIAAGADAGDIWQNEGISLISDETYPVGSGLITTKGTGSLYVIAKCRIHGYANPVNKFGNMGYTRLYDNSVGIGSYSYWSIPSGMSYIPNLFPSNFYLGSVEAGAHWIEMKVTVTYPGVNITSGLVDNVILTGFELK